MGRNGKISTSTRQIRFGLIGNTETGTNKVKRNGIPVSDAVSKSHQHMVILKALMAFEESALNSYPQL